MRTEVRPTRAAYGDTEVLFVVGDCEMASGGLSRRRVAASSSSADDDGDAWGINGSGAAHNDGSTTPSNSSTTSNTNATTTMNENARRDVLKDVSKQGTTRGSNHGIQTSCAFPSTTNMASKTCGIVRDTIRIRGMLELTARRCVRVRRLLL